MRTKKLGRTNIDVSIVGLGGANLGLPTTASVYDQYVINPNHLIYMDEQCGVEAVHTAFQEGMTLIDTAPLYCISEDIIGKALATYPDLAVQSLVTTKVGKSLWGNFDHSYKAAMASVARSRKRLHLDHFPILYIHDPMGFPMHVVMSKNGTMGALRDLQADGVVGYIGVAADNPTTAADYIATGVFDVATVSGAWSLINQTAAQRIFPIAKQWNVGIVVTTAIERGLLATGASLPRVTYHQRDFSPELLLHVKKIKSLCDDFTIPLLAVALQWVTRHPQVATTIPGARTSKEARANAEAGNVHIPETFWKELDPLVQHWDILTGY